MSQYGIKFFYVQFAIKRDNTLSCYFSKWSNERKRKDGIEMQSTRLRKDRNWKAAHALRASQCRLNDGAFGDSDSGYATSGGMSFSDPILSICWRNGRLSGFARSSHIPDHSKVSNGGDDARTFHFLLTLTNAQPPLFYPIFIGRSRFASVSVHYDVSGNPATLFPAVSSNPGTPRLYAFLWNGGPAYVLLVTDRST